jgi:hypothetical protein
MKQGELAVVSVWHGKCFSLDRTYTEQKGRCGIGAAAVYGARKLYESSPFGLLSKINRGGVDGL